MTTALSEKSYAVAALNGGLGAIFHPRCEKDKWDNDVTVIETPTHKYRMVHHTTPEKYRQKATLYGGRNKFVRVFTKTSDNGSVETFIEINNFVVSWGDGDNLGVHKLEGTWPKGQQDKRQTVQPEEDETILVAALCLIQDDNFEQVLITVIMYLEMHEDKWQRKPEK